MIKRFIWVLAIIACLSVQTSVGRAADGDVADSSDHELIGRFDGSVITSFQEHDFDEYTLPTGPSSGGVLAASLELEGRTFRIAYRAQSNQSIAEVARNFENRLTERGFSILFECKARDCGANDFRYAIETIALPAMQIDSWNYRYMAGELSDAGRDIYASVLVSTNNTDIFIQLVVVEVAKMEDRMVDAAEMATSISDTGHIALYGIHFGFDLSTIKPESEPSLMEIARLLTDNPSLQVVIVGHTDNQGDLNYNLDLSRQRAKAVMRALIDTYGIDAARLSSAGVAYLAPVSSNLSEEGRALNRRVELVQR
jgi:outer membrane protein OmpA-like peptidoglycan-associated protein